MKAEVTLTVGAAVDFNAQSNSALLTPVQWDEPQEAGNDSLLQLVPNCTLGVGVPRESLWIVANKHTYTSVKLNTSKLCASSQPTSIKPSR